jgi:DNA end-binding protein Ku
MSRVLEMTDFVPADSIDPRYFESPYFLVPREGGDKAYALLREAIKNTGKIGIGKITMRTNSLHLAGVKAVEDALVLEIMRFGDELVDASEFKFPSDSGVRPQELQMATQLVENLSSEFDPSKYTDDYHDNLMKIIKAKMKGKKIEVEEPEAPESTQVVDLIARLQESLDLGKRAKSGESHKPAKRAKSAKRAPRKSA